MINTYTYEQQKWISINQGNEDEIRDAVMRFDIDPYIAKEIATPNPKSRIEFYKDSIYLIMHFPADKHTHKNHKQEIDFIIKKDSLVTIQYENIDAIHKVSKIAEVKEILSKQTFDKNFFAIIMKELYNAVSEELLYIENKTDTITERIFKGHHKEMVLEISNSIKTTLLFERTTDSHRDLLQFLRDGSVPILGKEFSEDIDSVLLEYERMRRGIHNNLEILRELRNTNDSLLSAKQNEVMKNLTVITFIYLPINLIVAIFTMHANNTPFWTNPNSFYIILGICFATLLLMIYIAKHKKWM